MYTLKKQVKLLRAGGVWFLTVECEDGFKMVLSFKQLYQVFNFLNVCI